MTRPINPSFADYFRGEHGSNSPEDGSLSFEIRDAPTVIEYKNRIDAPKSSLFGHFVPSPNSKASIDMSCGKSPNTCNPIPARIRLRIPVHLSSFGSGFGKKVDVFVFYRGESIRRLGAALFSRFDAEDDQAGPGCPHCKCKCQYKGITEGTGIPVLPLTELPGPVRRALVPGYAHDESTDDDQPFYDHWKQRTVLGKHRHMYGYDTDVVKISVEPNDRPLLITPDGIAPEAASKVSRAVLDHVAGLLRNAASVSFYVPRLSVPRMTSLSAFQSIVREQPFSLMTAPKDAKFETFYRHGWSKLRSDGRYHERRLTGAVVKHGSSDAAEKRNNFPRDQDERRTDVFGIAERSIE